MNSDNTTSFNTDSLAPPESFQHAASMDPAPAPAHEDDYPLTNPYGGLPDSLSPVPTSEQFNRADGGEHAVADLHSSSYPTSFLTEKKEIGRATSYHHENSAASHHGVGDATLYEDLYFAHGGNNFSNSPTTYSSPPLPPIPGAYSMTPSGHTTHSSRYNFRPRRPRVSILKGESSSGAVTQVQPSIKGPSTRNVLLSAAVKLTPIYGTDSLWHCPGCCGASSKTIGDVERHWDFHCKKGNRRGFVCSQCPMVLSRKDVLKRHVKRAHRVKRVL